MREREESEGMRAKGENESQRVMERQKKCRVREREISLGEKKWERQKKREEISRSV